MQNFKQNILSFLLLIVYCEKAHFYHVYISLEVEFTLSQPAGVRTIVSFYNATYLA